MLFNSLHFLVFFPTVTLLYFLVPEAVSWLVLLAASYYFYTSWNGWVIILLFISTVIDYTAGICIADTHELYKKKWYLALSLCSNLALLALFKYANFFLQSAQNVSDVFGIHTQIPYLNVLLPVGISFYTFQTMSYTIDVYREQLTPERNFGKFALFVTFFPQLVAGPIERAGNLLAQFAHRAPFTYENAVIGLRTFLGGMLLKVVVADNLAAYVDAVYNNVHEFYGWPLLFATYLFAFQIFCDFAGYSYMAIGCARVLGFELMENFRQPYLATSIADFWRRWHISLSTWFRDYLYIPLGGNRVSHARWLTNVMLTFLISGLWHGASWTFVIWGGLNGLYQLVGFYVPESLSNVLPRFFKIGCTFVAVCFAWIFFRANSCADAWYIVTHMFAGLQSKHTLYLLRRAVLIGRTPDLPLLFGLTFFVWSVFIIQSFGSIRVSINYLYRPVRLSLYYAALLALLFFGEFGGQQFIYFQF